jgi:hypothetical protein
LPLVYQEWGRAIEDEFGSDFCGGTLLAVDVKTNLRSGLLTSGLSLSACLWPLNEYCAR